MNDPTHSASHTIDLIIARESDNLIKSVSVHDFGISDHSLVLCTVNSFIKERQDFIYTLKHKDFYRKIHSKQGNNALKHKDFRERFTPSKTTQH